MRYNPGGYQGVPNQREFRAAATGRPLQWARSDRPAALAAYLNDGFYAKVVDSEFEKISGVTQKQETGSKEHLEHASQSPND